MVKIRLMGTVSELSDFVDHFEDDPWMEVLDVSKLLTISTSDRFYRIFMQVQPAENSEEKE